MRDAYALNKKGLKAGNVYALNRGYALNNGVRVTTRVYGTRINIIERSLETLVPGGTYFVGIKIKRDRAMPL